MSSPTSCGHRPNTVAGQPGRPASLRDTREANLPNGCGSRSSGPDPDQRRRLPFGRRAAPDVRPSARRPRLPPSRPRATPLARDRNPRRSSRRPYGSAERPSGPAAVGDPVPRPGTTAPGSPAAGGRRGVDGRSFRAAHHQWSRSYPHYPQGCPQPVRDHASVADVASAVRPPRALDPHRPSPRTAPPSPPGTSSATAAVTRTCSARDGHPSQRAAADARPARRTHHRGQVPAPRPPRGAARTTPVAMRARMTTTRRDSRTPWRGHRQEPARVRHDADRPSSPRARAPRRTRRERVEQHRQQLDVGARPQKHRDPGRGSRSGRRARPAGDSARPRRMPRLPAVQVRHQIQPRGKQLSAVLGEVAVPNVESGDISPAAGRAVFSNALRCRSTRS